MLSMIDENDLAEFLETEPAQEEPETEEPQVVIPEPETTPAETEADPEPEKQPEGMNTGILLAAALLLAGGLVFYYLKVVKPKKAEDEAEGEDLEFYGGGDYINEDQAKDSGQDEE